MKKIVILGTTGMLGRTVYKHLKEQNCYSIVTLNRENIDLSKCSYTELMKELELLDVDVLINCAGLIVQRKETLVEDFLHVNSIIPRWLSNISEELNIKMIHVTTDCVFTGTNGPYNEEDSWDVRDIYGVSKVLGEPDNCTVIRSSIIGEELHNKLSFLEWVRSEKGNKIKGFTNHIWNGVTCLQMSKIINHIIETDGFWGGVRHFYSPSVSKADMVEYINDVYDLSITVERVGGDVVDKTLTSKYRDVSEPNLKLQIQEQKDFWLV